MKKISTKTSNKMQSKENNDEITQSHEFVKITISNWTII